MNENKIPKIIHYCWFGKKEKPQIVKQCIESWNNILTDYKIIEWNETNFDIYCNEYVKKAYNLGKYAFVSDYARVWVLYNYGGIYLDTDVEVLKKFDNLLENECILGFEEENYIATSTIGTEKYNTIMKEFMEIYDLYNDKIESNEFKFNTNVTILTDMLEKKGLIRNGEYQIINNVCIFPQEFFSPYDYANYETKITDKSYCIHHFYKSWVPWKLKIKGSMKKIIVKLIGSKGLIKLRKMISN